MIYRILVDHRYHTSDGDGVFVARRWKDLGDYLEPGMCGASYGVLALVMFDRGLAAPALRNRRLRFYFTQRGWRDVGRHVAAKAREMGHVVSVIRRKEPAASQVAYRDALQVALLPNRNRQLTR